MSVCADTEPLRARLLDMAADAGAVAAGFAAAGEVDVRQWDAFTGFLRAGGHFSMEWLENYPEIRRNPLKLFTPGATQGTVMSLAFPYYHPGTNPLIARYAQGYDYHRVLRRLLKPLMREITDTTGLRARICTDSAPILERYWAVKAGVGFIGLNHCLIVPSAGSYVFLAEIVMEAVLRPSAPCTMSCRGCRRCLEVCPGGALSGVAFDSSRCQSCLTIEHHGDLAEGALRGPAVYGCDLCQSVCPHNARPAAGLSPFAPRPSVASLTAARLASLTPEEYAELTAGSAMTRCPLPQLRRNLAGMSSGHHG